MNVISRILKAALAGVSILTMHTVSGQETQSWELGLGVGYTNYYGDLSPYQINGLKNLYRIAYFNKNYQDRPSFSLMLHKKVTPTLGFMIQANYLQFSMSDRYRMKSGELDLSAKHFSRSLNFSNDMKDIGLAFTFNANNGRAFSKTAFFYPSFFLGAGVSQFTVKGDLYDANNARYNYLLPGNINDGTFETNLRDLRTEQDNRYDNVVPYVDLGLALNFRLSERLTFAVQSDIKYSASDYLDDVSKLYKTSYSNPAEAYAAKPGYNVVDPSTRVRGDNNAMNDFYFNNRLVLHIGLGSKKKTETFTAPVIYTLAAPYRLRKTTVDSTRIKQVADSIKKVREDSAFRARVDSVKILQDSILNQTQKMQANDSAVRTQLSAITTELQQLKSAVQPADTRKEKIRQQTDSIQAAKKKISDQRKISEEDRLRLRIYDFQLDSLNRESQKIVAEPQSAPARISGQNLRTDSQRVARDPEMEAYSKELDQLKKDKRYKSDTAFRRNVDTLQSRFQRYKPVTTVTASSQNQSRIDSLQARIDYLEKEGRKNSANITTEKPRLDTTVTERASKDDNSAVDTVISTRVRSATPAQRDTVQAKKKWYQRLFSTGREKSDTIARVDTRDRPDTTVQKRKWYQRLFSTGKERKDTIVTVETRERPDTTTRKRNFFQRLFSTGKPDRDTVVTIETRNGPDTATRKKNFFQRLFGTGSKERVDNSTGYGLNDSTREGLSTRQTSNISQSRQSRDTASRVTAARGKNTTTSTVNSPRERVVAADTVRQTNTTRRNQRQTVVAPANIERVDPSTAKDTAELNRLIRETEQARVRNEASVAALQAQLKRSNDSAAFYRSALVQSSRIQPEEETTTRRRGIFSNRRKEEEEARQREQEQELMRERYLEQQRYQADQAAQLQRRINDLQVNNSNYSRYQDDYSNELRRRSLTDNLSTTALVLDNASRNNSGSSELYALREELNRLKAQVNEQDVRLRVADTLARRDSSATSQAIQPVSTGTPAVDTSAMQVMRSGLTMLREELDRLKSQPADTVSVEPVPDLSSFPVISVYFANGATTVAPDQVAKLRPLVQAASKNKKANILLRGFADATGNAAINRQVVQKRLNAVRSLLVSKYNLSLYRIASDEPQVSTERGRPNPLDRRVDLSFQ